VTEISIVVITHDVESAFETADRIALLDTAIFWLVNRPSDPSQSGRVRADPDASQV
jgi:ABC-type proline/glycine betaine transport system ATPase subunit